jgi:cytochrome P450
MLRTLDILTARVMMSSAAPHDKSWVTLTTEYVISAIQYARELKMWPAFLRPLVYRFLPSYRAVQNQLDGGRKMVIETMKEDEKHDTKGLPPPDPPTFMWALTRRLEDKTPQAIESHLREQMNLAVGGIHTTSSVLTQTLFQLVAHLEHIPLLRKEALEATEKCDGKLNEAALWDMIKTDSFVSETHRLHSPNLSKY